jgi:hypothetical protein
MADFLQPFFFSLCARGNKEEEVIGNDETGGLDAGERERERERRLAKKPADW